MFQKKRQILFFGVWKDEIEKELVIFKVFLLKCIGVVLVDEEMYLIKVGVFDVVIIRYRNIIVFFKGVIQLYMYIYNYKRNLCFFIDVSEKEEFIFKQYLIMIIEICILKVKKYIYVFIIKFKSVWFFMCYLENVE